MTSFVSPLKRGRKEALIQVLEIEIECSSDRGRGKNAPKYQIDILCWPFHAPKRRTYSSRVAAGQKYTPILSEHFIAFGPYIIRRDLEKMVKI